MSSSMNSINFVKSFDLICKINPNRSTFLARFASCFYSWGCGESDAGPSGRDTKNTFVGKDPMPLPLGLAIPWYLFRHARSVVKFVIGS